MMRKSSRIALLKTTLVATALLFCLILQVPVAKADITYTLDFTCYVNGCDSVGAPLQTTITYNTTSDSFDAFSFTWDNVQFSYPGFYFPESSTYILDTVNGFDCDAGNGVGNCTLEFDENNLDLLWGDGVTNSAFPQAPGAVSDQGTVNFVVTPEPSTAILWLSGAGLMILRRKRIAQMLSADI